MPKKHLGSFIVLLSLAVLLMMLGCGSGDSVTAPRTEDALGEIFSGGTGTVNNNDNNGGGGGGGVGRCMNVYGFSGACVDTNDFSGLTSSICTNSYSGTWELNLLCP